MRGIVFWVNHHDSAKLLLTTLAMIPIMGMAIAVSGDLDPFFYLVLVGMLLCGMAAYWLGNWKWIFIPLLAMLVEIAWAIPVSLRDPNAMETPFSIVFEAPFWTGIPTLLGAGLGYLIKRVNG